MVRVRELKERQPSAWTRLLAHNPETKGIIVTSVDQEEITHDQPGIRYLLHLEGHPEPISLIGKQTSASAARFYRFIAPEVPYLAPRCWFSHVSGDKSWVVLDEVHNDWPTETWTATDVEAIINAIASLHATFWDQAELLTQYGISSLIETSDQSQSESVDEKSHSKSYHMQPLTNEERIGKTYGRQTFISDHARRVSRNLEPVLVKASSGLATIHLLGGWPGVLDEEQMKAFADLLDDPLPMLYTLRQLPVTLLHGDLSNYQWHSNMFGEYRLPDWYKVIIGPGIYDFVTFRERFDLLKRGSGGWKQRHVWPISSETMEDSYILAMRSKLGSRYDAMENRQSLAAAQCLYTITTWLPLFDDWFHHVPNDQDLWTELNQYSDQELAEAGFGEMVGMRQYLAAVINRFVEATQLL